MATLVQTRSESKPFHRDVASIDYHESLKFSLSLISVATRVLRGAGTLPALLRVRGMRNSLCGN